jgi:hypothetical protein
MNFDDVNNGPRWLSEADLAAAAQHFQEKADGVLRLFGQAAPPIQPDEEIANYRRRLLRCVQPHTDGALRHVKVARLPAGVLDNFEQVMIADTVANFKKPEGAPLRMAIERDETGRAHRKFYGDPENTWAPFKPRLVRTWRKLPHVGVGENSPRAIAAAAERAAYEVRFNEFMAAERAAAGVRGG